MHIDVEHTSKIIVAVCVLRSFSPALTMLRSSVCKLLPYRLFNQSLLNLLFLLTDILQHIRLVIGSVELCYFSIWVHATSLSILIQVR